MRVLLLVSLVACGKSSGSKAEKTEGPPHISNHALATTPLQNIASTAGGKAFTIDLPMAELKAPEVKGAYATWEAKQGWFDTPTFTVLFNDMPAMPDSTGDTEPMGDDAKDRAIVRAEKLPDGGYINIDERKDHAFYRLEVCRPLAGGTLCCSVTQRDDKPLEAFDEIKAFAEKVCRSMKAS